MTTYNVRRMFFDESRETETIKTGLTLEEAQAHCRDPETSSQSCSPETAALVGSTDPWFDGYDED